MSYDCTCDYDPPEFYHREIRRARKLRTCGECGGLIKPGNTCERCVDGNRIEDCREAIEEAALRARDEVRGLRFGLMRRIVARDRLNQANRRAES